MLQDNGESNDEDDTPSDHQQDESKVNGVQPKNEEDTYYGRKSAEGDKSETETSEGGKTPASVEVDADEMDVAFGASNGTTGSADRSSLQGEVSCESAKVAEQSVSDASECVAPTETSAEQSVLEASECVASTETSAAEAEKPAPEPMSQEKDSFVDAIVGSAEAGVYVDTEMPEAAVAREEGQQVTCSEASTGDMEGPPGRVRAAPEKDGRQSAGDYE